MGYLFPCCPSRFETCWPALMKDSHGVVIVFNPDLPSHLKEIEMWYSCFVQQQQLLDSQCLLIAHHKPGSGGDIEDLALRKTAVLVFQPLTKRFLLFRGREHWLFGLCSKGSVHSVSS